jgi:phosphoribosylformylglycinamidine cyclo-ligase
VEAGGLSWDGEAPFAVNRKLGAALLTPTRIYVRSALEAIRAGNSKDGGVKGFAHITGGGLTENLPRALPEGLDAEVNLESWTPAPVFGWLAKSGGVAPAEMLRTFNCGIGLVAVVAENAAGHVIDAFQNSGDKAVRLGKLIAAEKKDGASGAGGEPKVVYRGTLKL